MVLGFKLIIVCPPTDHNLVEFSKIDIFGDLERVKPALSKFEGVYYYIVREGDMFVLEPGSLHTVLSPVNSALVGWKCYKSEWVNDLDRLMSWDKKLSGWNKNTFDAKMRATKATYQRLFRDPA
jgi:hypothetical protein